MSIFTNIRSRVWLHNASGLRIWLPEDKRTFRVVTADGIEITSKRFRTRHGAAKFIERLSA